MVDSRLGHGAVGSRDAQKEDPSRVLCLGGADDGEAVAPGDHWALSSPREATLWSHAVDARLMQVHWEQSEHMQFTILLHYAFKY